MSSKSKKILVTGVAGFLGSHLAEKLVHMGHSVIGIDSMLGGYEDNVPKNIEFHKGDCCDFEKVKSIECSNLFKAKVSILLSLYKYSLIKHCNARAD